MGKKDKKGKMGQLEMATGRDSSPPSGPRPASGENLRPRQDGDKDGDRNQSPNGHGDGDRDGG